MKTKYELIGLAALGAAITVLLVASAPLAPQSPPVFDFRAHFFITLRPWKRTMFGLQTSGQHPERQSDFLSVFHTSHAGPASIWHSPAATRVGIGSPARYPEMLPHFQVPHHLLNAHAQFLLQPLAKCRFLAGSIAMLLSLVPVSYSQFVPGPNPISGQVTARQLLPMGRGGR